MKKILALLFSIAFFGANAAIIDQEPLNWHELSTQELENYCWKSDKPQYTINEVPEKWEKFGAVLLHIEEVYEIRSKTKTRFSHRRIKIQDKSVLEYYSELYYSGENKGAFSVLSGNADKLTMGIKIIKPSGEEIKVDTENIIEDENGDKKVAVPGLEVGDIVDFYQHLVFNNKATFSSYERLNLNSDYPVARLDYTIITESSAIVYFDIINSEEEIEEEKLGEKKQTRYSFKFTKENIEPKETDFWYYAEQHEPYLKMLVSLKNYNSFNRIGLKYPGQMRSTSLNLSHMEGYMYGIIGNKSEVKRAISRNKKFKKMMAKRKLKKASTEVFVREYYRFLQLSMNHPSNFNPAYDYYSNQGFGAREREFLLSFMHLLAKNKMNADVFMMPSRSVGTIEDVFVPMEMNAFLRIKIKEKFYYVFCPGLYSNYQSTPGFLEGAKAYRIGNYYGFSRFEGDAGTFDIPVSEAEKNQNKTLLDVKIAEDFEKVKVKAKLEFTGLQRAEHSDLLIDRLAFYDKYAKIYSPQNHAAFVKNKQTEFEDLKEYIEKSREQYVKQQFNLPEEDITEVTYKDVKYGVEKNNKKYKSEYTSEVKGLIKKVGPNYILKVGKLVGGQLTLDESQLERTVPVDMKFARKYSYKISIAVPEGYAVKGLEKLNNDIENETGKFYSKAELVDNKIIIVFEKTYAHNEEPAENWDKMKQFLVPASKFVGRELLFKKL